MGTHCISTHAHVLTRTFHRTNLFRYVQHFMQAHHIICTPVKIFTEKGHL